MNNEPIRIEATDEALDALKEDPSALHAAMDLEVHVMRAEVFDPRIECIEVRGDEITVWYEFDWSVYNGCDNMNGADCEHREKAGVLDDGYWVFQRFVPPPSRTTFEEY